MRTKVTAAKRRTKTRAPSANAPIAISPTHIRGVDLMVLSYPLPETETQQNLTRAEAEVIAALLAGRSNAAIAKQRGVSPRTVANQIAALLRKQGVASRTELVAQWVRTRG